MSSQETDNRVLARAGASLLSEAEFEEIAGGFAISRYTFDPTTCHVDGVCTPLPRRPV